jgi:hypothetical protein
LENLTKPLIRQQLNREIEKRMSDLDITIDWKMKILKEMIEGCMNGEASQHRIHSSGVVSGISELNKMQGHYQQNESGEKINYGDIAKMVKEC